jgi:hypothetical protein
MPPLSYDRVQVIAREAARKHFCAEDILDIRVTDTRDMDGAPALDITTVIGSEDVASTPYAAVNTLTDLHDALLAEGDERFPFVHYATPEDLQCSDDDDMELSAEFFRKDWTP